MKIKKILKKLGEFEALLDQDMAYLRIYSDGSGDVSLIDGSIGFDFSSFEALSQKLDQEIKRLKPKEIEFNRQLCEEWARNNHRDLVCNKTKGLMESRCFLYSNAELDEYIWFDPEKEGVDRYHSARPLKDVVLEWARGRE